MTPGWLSTYLSVVLQCNIETVNAIFYCNLPTTVVYTIAHELGKHCFIVPTEVIHPLLNQRSFEFMLSNPYPFTGRLLIEGHPKCAYWVLTWSEGEGASFRGITQRNGFYEGEWPIFLNKTISCIREILRSRNVVI